MISARTQFLVGTTTLSVTVLAADSWKVIRKMDGRTTITGDWKPSQETATHSRTTSLV